MMSPIQGQEAGLASRAHKYGVIFLILFLFPIASNADYVEVRRNANLYSEPNSRSDVIEYFDISQSTQTIYLVVESDELTNGYHNVRFRDGSGSGWIYKTRVRKRTGNPPGTFSMVGLAIYGGDPVTTDTEDFTSRQANSAYVVGYSETKSNPLWVAYHLTENSRFNCPRLTRFRTDRRTIARVSHTDYNNTGYDRGHMAPSHNIGSRYGCPAQNETYLTSNIAPQIPLLNQRPWGGFERLIANNYAPEFGGVWVFTGPIFDPIWVHRLCSGIEIPIAFYKIIIRTTDNVPDVLAVVFNQDTQPLVELSDLVTTIDEIESQTNIDFLSGLPDTLENSIERLEASSNDWLLETQLDTNFRPQEREFCVLESVMRSEFDHDQ